MNYTTYPMRFRWQYTEDDETSPLQADSPEHLEELRDRLASRIADLRYDAGGVACGQEMPL